jgi:predicted lipid-binding transport protein (Tim44 family)
MHMPTWNGLVLATGMLVALMLTAGGCTSEADRQFATSDAQLITAYVQQAQPAVEEYCALQRATGDAVKIQQAATLLADSRALAQAVGQNQKSRLAALDSQAADVQRAKAALAIVAQLLSELRSLSPPPATQPAAQP